MVMCSLGDVVLHSAIARTYALSLPRHHGDITRDGHGEVLLPRRPAKVPHLALTPAVESPKLASNDETTKPIAEGFGRASLRA